MPFLYRVADFGFQIKTKNYPVKVFPLLKKAIGKVNEKKESAEVLQQECREIFVKYFMLRGQDSYFASSFPSSYTTVVLAISSVKQ